MPESPFPFLTRLWFAWVCFFRVLLDGGFAARAWSLRGRSREQLEPTSLPSAKAPPVEPSPTEPLPSAPSASTKAARSEAVPAPAKEKPAPEPPSVGPALQLLALLQREGRLVDFLEQDIVPFSDAEIGAAVRVVHEGCRKALRGHAKLEPVMKEDEGAIITVQVGFNPAEVKLSGNVQGSAPYKGTLKHRGWRASELSLPTPVAGHDPAVVAPAEVEI